MCKKGALRGRGQRTSFRSKSELAVELHSCVHNNTPRTCLEICLHTIYIFMLHVCTAQLICAYTVRTHVQSAYENERVNATDPTTRAHICAQRLYGSQCDKLLYMCLNVHANLCARHAPLKSGAPIKIVHMRQGSEIESNPELCLMCWAKKYSTG